MAGFLSKFVAGAASAGSKLLADQHQDDYRAKLQSKRDSVLDANRKATQASSQAFQQQLATSSQEHRTSETTSRQDYQKSQTASTQAWQEKQTEKSQAFQKDLVKDKAVAKKKTDKKDIMQTSQAMTMVNNTHKTLVAEQAETIMNPADRIPSDELLQQAYDMVDKVLRGPSKSPTPDPVIDPIVDPVIDPVIDPAEESPTPKGFVKLSNVKPTENIAKEKKGNKRFIKRGGVWLTIIEQ